MLRVIWCCWQNAFNALCNGGGTMNWVPLDFTSFDRIEPERAGFNEVDHLSTGELVNVSHGGPGFVGLSGACVRSQFYRVSVPPYDGGREQASDVHGPPVGRDRAVWRISAEGFLSPRLGRARPCFAGERFSGRRFEQHHADGAVVRRRTPHLWLGPFRPAGSRHRRR